jgi:FtsH-binding integral membrane protein
MSLYGYSTNKDLTSAGSFLIMGLIGLVIISLVNIFLQSAAVNFVLSVAGIGIFMGLTAWDTQKLKGMYLLLWWRRSGSENCHYGSIYLVSGFY